MNEPGTHKLAEAMEGQGPATDIQAEHAGPPGPGTTPEQVAEQTRRQQEARSDATESRDEKLVQIGRGQQTHG